MFRYSKELAQMALGNQKAPLVLKNANLVQVFTNEIIQADIAIADGYIVGVGTYHGEQEVDLSGRYVCPGFIDAHLHLESTLVNPAELIETASLRGTTTFIVDPHEAANVSGTEGIDYILNETEESQANVYVMMPSCVPAGPFEDNGCTLTAEDMKSYVGNPRILGLGEVMDCGGVLNGDSALLDKLTLFRDKSIDGHAGYLNEEATNAYSLAGIGSDHECCTFEAALREMRAGFQILVREGSAAKNLDPIIRGVVANRLPYHQLAFCTDDKHIADIRIDGHINYNVRRAIALGVPPIEAIKIGSLYPAKHYGLRHLGAIAPGFQADILVLSDLEQVTVERVYHKGVPVVEYLERHRPVPENLLNTVHIKLDGIEALRLPMCHSKARVIELIPGEILTKECMADVKVEEGFFQSDATYQKIVVLERHRATGKIGIGIVKGFSIQGGAIASTVGHDSHNLIAVGDEDEEIYRAIRALEACGGGYTVVVKGQEPVVIPLEIMGLMSNECDEVVQPKLSEMIEIARSLGVPEGIAPFINLSFLSLPVIPEVRITPRGLYHVTEGCFKPVNEKG
ncbi:MAG: adenine deaminase [Clostridia bacterium]|nr:adenine deaminase [Clostridia bacterium]